MRLGAAALAGLLILCAPAQAQSVGPLTQSAGSQDGDTADLDTQRAQYSQWLSRLEAEFDRTGPQVEALKEVISQLVQSNGSASSIAHARAAIAAARRAMQQSIAVLEALDAPEFPLLPLPEALTCTEIRRVAIEGARHRLDLVEGASQMVEAVVRRNLSAVIAGNARVISAAKGYVLLQARVNEARASLFVPGSAAYSYHRLRAIVATAKFALLGTASANGSIRSGPQFQGKIELVIAALEEVIATAEPYVAQQSEMIAATDAGGNSLPAAELEQHRAENRISRALILQARAMIVHFRALLASARRGRPLNEAEFTGATEQTLVFETTLDNLSRQI